mmetsp:Transcript_22409/g.43564  ORF Transcript_22409/g.43564 Transcript_22409/m.43564 type:complete len:609 (+) Transcript_22409:550-2376(+)|eukprot:CAMPEP_0167802568 /NCGR_PEP_ID=MMETSP0111_2-20121227/19220_1 /TAXON_ID=91324 /ORGANISM="Lotharella globosa, Strain CCCM811" /LENGTH=608 /DNA_ID=CAMNT_0007698675 /DNA_START=488 /DNA_END=2314 /DNA_ORIENTATION=-
MLNGGLLGMLADVCTDVRKNRGRNADVEKLTMEVEHLARERALKTEVDFPAREARKQITRTKASTTAGTIDFSVSEKKREIATRGLMMKTSSLNSRKQHDSETKSLRAGIGKENPAVRHEQLPVGDSHWNSTMTTSAVPPHLQTQKKAQSLVQPQPSPDSHSLQQHATAIGKSHQQPDQLAPALAPPPILIPNAGLRNGTQQRRHSPGAQSRTQNQRLQDHAGSPPQQQPAYPPPQQQRQIPLPATTLQHNRLVHSSQGQRQDLRSLQAQANPALQRQPQQQRQQQRQQQQQKHLQQQSLPQQRKRNFPPPQQQSSSSMSVSPVGNTTSSEPTVAGVVGTDTLQAGWKPELVQSTSYFQDPPPAKRVRRQNIVSRRPPKRKRSAYNFFQVFAQRQLLKKFNIKDFHRQSLSRKIGQWWCQLSNEHRKHFEQLARQDAERFERQQREYAGALKLQLGPRKRHEPCRSPTPTSPQISPPPTLGLSVRSPPSGAASQVRGKWPIPRLKTRPSDVRNGTVDSTKNGLQHRPAASHEQVDSTSPLSGTAVRNSQLYRRDAVHTPLAAPQPPPSLHAQPQTPPTSTTTDPLSSQNTQQTATHPQQPSGLNDDAR